MVDRCPYHLKKVQKTISDFAIEISLGLPLLYNRVMCRRPGILWSLDGCAPHRPWCAPSYAHARIQINKVEVPWIRAFWVHQNVKVWLYPKNVRSEGTVGPMLVLKYLRYLQQKGKWVILTKLDSKRDIKALQISQNVQEPLMTQSRIEGTVNSNQYSQTETGWQGMPFQGILHNQKRILLISFKQKAIELGW